ncbi:MAG: hypothetical protein AB2989_04885 [Candidatus Symbiodolus clandestinus]
MIITPAVSTNNISVSTTGNSYLSTASSGPFEIGFDTLSAQMSYLSKDAEDYYKTLQEKTQLSKKADEILSSFDKDAAKKFLNDHYPKAPESGSWGSASDDDLKAGLEAFKTSQSDFVAESQLKIQRVMQTYNTTATLFNSLQVILADMNKMVAQSIR